MSRIQTKRLNEINTVAWVEALIPARTRDEQEQLKDNIQSNGQSTPIIIADVSDSENVIIDGHGRYQALSDLGEKTIKCEFKDFESQSEIESFMLLQQLGRRNLTTRQRNYMIGQTAIRAKSADNLSSLTYDQIAVIYKVTTKTVSRAIEYAHKIDNLVKEGASKDELLELSVAALNDVTSSQPTAKEETPHRKEEKKNKTKKYTLPVNSQTKKVADVLKEKYDYKSANEVVSASLRLLEEWHESHN